MSQGTVCEPGTAVFDNASRMVGVVQERRGSVLILIRPSGLRWQTRAISVRLVNDRERIQLAALARHHQQARTLAKLRQRVTH
ncbi:hypothetical protein [Streptomyces sp. NRRL F-5650]|uniref:hypothetical protein n=1 Tax=Streptomyces sp. NRRL F-5650 TaxID=1463868 RepID=UPI00131E51AB|nr:hypothetical protein [Streptomyces sp. NRRL F-5650]